MKLNKIKLKNIRSYINQEVIFPDGITLLSGDVGSGKSTILLAIDFALFGLRRGSLSGSALLRNGEKQGHVELHFEIEKVPIVIKRTLKRGSAIIQDSGYVIENNKRKDLSPLEIKQYVITLLNYPQELLTKFKSLIYRYTVYTPQEEMKHILLGNKDYRLDTLRKVFGIDKYKRIKDNCFIFITHLKQKRKELEGKIFDLDIKKQLLKDKQKEVSEVKEKLNELKPLLTEINKIINEKKKDLKRIEENIKSLQEAKKELEVEKLNLKLKTEQKKKNKEQIENLADQIIDLKDELQNLPTTEIEPKKLKELQISINLFEATIRSINEKITEYKVKINSSKEIIEKISSIDICPLCRQQVTREHIKKVKEKEKDRINLYNSESKIYNSRLIEANNKINKNKQDLEELRKRLHLQEKLKIVKQNLDEKQESLKNLKEENRKINIDEIKTKITYHSKGLENFSYIEKDLKQRKSDLESKQEDLKQLEIEKAGFEKEISSIQNSIEEVKQEIQEKTNYKKELSKWTHMQHFLNTHFTNLVSLIERKIMLKVHADFDNLFQKWFDIIIDNDLLNIKLDEEFTPFIEQAGHQLDYDYLSGGEKTAAALAYRLALNQVINSLVSTIRTKDILILDEPTDGFSSEQLDRIRIVLDQLKINQIIIVSHESKIESFVDNIVRVDKREHVSEVIHH